MPPVHERLTDHEKICAERYESINFRLTRIEWVLIVVAGSLIAGMSTLLIQALNLSHKIG